MNTKALSYHQRVQILDFFAQYMSPDMREKLMGELPQAYNAWAESEVVRVVNVARADGWKPINLLETQAELAS